MAPAETGLSFAREKASWLQFVIRNSNSEPTVSFTVAAGEILSQQTNSTNKRTEKPQTLSEMNLISDSFGACLSLAFIQLVALTEQSPAVESSSRDSLIIVLGVGASDSQRDLAANQMSARSRRPIESELSCSFGSVICILIWAARAFACSPDPASINNNRGRARAALESCSAGFRRRALARNPAAYPAKLRDKKQETESGGGGGGDSFVFWTIH